VASALVDGPARSIGAIREDVGWLLERWPGLAVGGHGCSRARGAVAGGGRSSSAPFHSADLRGAMLDDLSCWSPGPPYTDLGEASPSLKGARLYGADLRKAQLEKAKLTGADLSSVDLADATLAGATYDAKTRFSEGFDPDTHGLLPAPDAD